MRVLVACEFSGRVRDAFKARGHDAWSCDLLPTETPGQHYQGDVRTYMGLGWDLMIAHPPCTYLSAMGIWWNHKRPERWPLTNAARDFVADLWDSGVPMICIENPVGWLNKNWRTPAQTVQPWMFGHEATKPTCLWLKELPPLFPTRIVGRGEFYTKANGERMSKWSHIQSGSRGPRRAKVASRTFEGIAAAMAEQWG